MFRPRKCSEAKRSRAEQHRMTRWVERQEIVNEFELLPTIDAPTNISLLPASGSNSVGKAIIFVCLLNGAFYVTDKILVAVVKIIKSLLC